MKATNQDPIAQALKDYLSGEEEATIQVRTDISEWEGMAASYFFRDIEGMPEHERLAMSMANGRILDVGAGAGCHSLHLQRLGHEVLAIEQSAALCHILEQQAIPHVQTDIRTYDTQETFDSILLLMNGIGMAGTLSELEGLLATIAKLLAPGGQIFLDSGDIQHLYMDDEGALIVDLSKAYHGEIEYEVRYEDRLAKFPWLFVDEVNLRNTAQSLKLECEKIWEEGSSFLVVLRHK